MNIENSTLTFGVNGKIFSIESSSYDPSTTLLSYLREDLGLVGTKVGCGEGGCGACTVILSRKSREELSHRSVAACLIPLGYLHGMHVTTIEGVSEVPVAKTIQDRLVKSHSVQCGYCTPGIVMSLCSLMCQQSTADGSPPSIVDIEECLDGNLCRCTGYRPIMETALSLHHDPIPGDGWQPAWPAGLEAKPQHPLCFSDGTTTWYRPTSLSELLELLSKVEHGDTSLVAGLSSLTKPSWHPDAHTTRLLAGNTDVGYERRYHPDVVVSTYISVLGVPELHEHRFEQDHLFVGAGVTIHGLATLLKDVARHPRHCQDPGFRAVMMQLRYFANKQVRDMGTLGGSIVAADPISDLYTPLNALNATIVVVSLAGGTRTVPSCELKLSPGELMLGVQIPYSDPQLVCVESFKQAKRRLDSQAILNAAFYLEFPSPQQHVVKVARIAFGGCSSTAGQRFPKTEAQLIGRDLADPALQDLVAQSLLSEAAQLLAKSRGNVQYRTTLVASLWHKFWLCVYASRNLPLPPKDRSATLRYHVPQRSSAQVYAVTPSVSAAASPKSDSEQAQRCFPIGQPIPHLSAAICAQGSAKFLDDIAPPRGTLHAAVILSTRPHADLLGIDTTFADEHLRDQGFVACITAREVPHSNMLGSILQDEPVFASGRVCWPGQLIALCVATRRHVAQRAAKLVQVKYGPALPFVHSIDDAIKANSFLCPPRVLSRSNIQGQSAPAVIEFAASAGSPLLVVRGRVFTNGQDHMYIELPAAQVSEEDGGQRVDVRCTSQNPTMVQRAVASMLGAPLKNVHVRVDRIGGGFGGKQDRPSFLASACAAAARATGAPVRLTLEREEDMCMMGKRHPFQSDYTIVIDKQTQSIVALQVDMYANGGYTLDLTDNTVQVAMAVFDGCYALADPRIALHINGFSCKTNRPSNTAFRGFGKPEAIAVMESILEHTAHALHIDPTFLREKFFISASTDCTIFGQKLVDIDRARNCWSELRLLSDFDQRKAQVDAFNDQNMWRKRGISIIPTKSNVGFEEPSMNQSGALVNIYLDGTILITHGGVEMGQGLHTKMAAVAVAELSRCGVAPDLSMITVSSTQTASVPNTNPTAAVTGTELNGRAVRNACQQLALRLKPIFSRLTTSSSSSSSSASSSSSSLSHTVHWDQLVQAAYHDHVGLSVTGHGSLLDQFSTYDWTTRQGDTQYYFIWGASCSEIELDVLTGTYRILRNDIVHDCGRAGALNPAIEVGQIEGGFAQGLGLFTLEDQIWDPRDGHLRTRNVSTYKIPSHDDMPLIWNIHLLSPDRTEVASGSSEDHPLYSAKTAGESGLQLSYSVISALRAAIQAVDPSILDSNKASLLFHHPFTVDHIRSLCPSISDVIHPRGAL